MQASRRLQASFVALFVIALFLPGLAMLMGSGTDPDTGEKRVLAAFPDFATTPLPEFPRKVDEWIRDHFGFRESLIRWNNRFKVRVLHSSPVRNAIVGRDDWLFYAGYDDGADIRDHLGRLPLAPAEIEARRKTIVERAAFFAQRGITYLFVVVPNKQTIYPERTGLRRGPRPITRLDQVTWVWRDDPALPFLDLRETLLAARSQSNLYYKTDSHWNYYGGLLGFRAILRRLATMRPDVTPVGDPWVRLADRPMKGGDVAALLAMSDEFEDQDQDIEWLDESQSSLRVVLIGDSFTESLYPFFATRFAYVDPIEEAVAGHFDAAAVLTQHPDLVIEAHVERYLMSW
jgi:alginate O-acetyltransferase complex protein AlgJ